MMNLKDLNIDVILKGLQKRFDELKKSIDDQSISGFINIKGRNTKKVDDFMMNLESSMESEIMKYMTETQSKYFQALVKFYFKKNPQIIFMWPEEIKDILKEVLTIR